MSLSKLLSNSPTEDYQQVDTFWLSQESEEYEDVNDDGEIPIPIGGNVVLDIGQISKNYYCVNCENIRTFNSIKEQELYGIVVSQQMLSIDCTLWCNCGATVHTWFLIEAKHDIRNQSPLVRTLHFREKLSEDVKSQSQKYGEFSEWLEKAKQAHHDGLGAGAVIYLRKVFEATTYAVAKANNIKTFEGKRRISFSKILQEVNEKHAIIPSAFSKDGYNLYRKLSNIIHGDGGEDEALEYFGALYTLVTGVIDNIRQTDELNGALQKVDFNGHAPNIS